ncbi:MAG: hypothetical protein AB2A00_35145 [Myxococcota bacterium]
MGTAEALMPRVIILGFPVPLDPRLPIRVGISAAFPVAALAWVIPPRLTRLLYDRLHAPETPPHARHARPRPA